MLAQRLDHLVGRQPHLAQLLDIEFAAADDDRRLAVEQPPENPALEREPAQQDLEHDQRRDRDDA